MEKIVYIFKIVSSLPKCLHASWSGNNLCQFYLLARAAFSGCVIKLFTCWSEHILVHQFWWFAVNITLGRNYTWILNFGCLKFDNQFLLDFDWTKLACFSRLIVDIKLMSYVSFFEDIDWPYGLFLFNSLSVFRQSWSLIKSWVLYIEMSNTLLFFYDYVTKIFVMYSGVLIVLFV